MGNSFRPQPFPTTYGPNQTPVQGDLLQIGLILAFGIIAFSFILIIPGIRGWERLWATIRVFVALWIGAVIVICNFGSWYTDSICTRTPYKAHVNPPNAIQEIQAEVGLSIGLRGMNITLREESCFDSEYIRPFPDEEIDYNEEFLWSNPWMQGRRDFGEFGGRFNQEFRAAKFRGVPYPIQYVAEPFTLDGDGIRWYRRYRNAGWYTQYWLWIAFATYIVSVLLFIHVIRWGAWFMLITAGLLLAANVTYSLMTINDPELEIYFHDATLRPRFNYSFWMTLWTGAIALVLAIVILVGEWRWPRETAIFFHHSIIEDDSLFEGYGEEEEVGLDEFGIVTKGSRISHGGLSQGGSGRRFGRRGTQTHLRKESQSSVHSTKSGGAPTRGGVRERKTSKQTAEIELQEVS